MDDESGDDDRYELRSGWGGDRPWTTAWDWSLKNQSPCH